MATIRDIITAAYRYSGILNDKAEPDGNRATEAEGFLNQIIYNYNLENYSWDYITGAIYMAEGEEDFTDIDFKKIA
jgi:hypothetical protein